MTHLAFVDLEKAFDRLKRAKLCEILRHRGFPHHLISVVKNLYKYTGMRIANANIWMKINGGVRQGCSLSAILSTLYLDDLVMKWKQQAPLGVKIRDDCFINILLYADDLVLLR